MINCHYISTVAFYRIAYKKGWTVATASQSQLYKFDKEQDYILYSNRIDIVDFLKDDSPIKLYRFLFLDFKKFIKLKKGLINKEFYKLFPKKYYDSINIYL